MGERALPRRIDHIVALVRDADAAFETFAERLGLAVSWPPETHAAGWRNGAVWLGNCSLEVLCPVEPAASGTAGFFGQALEERGEGLFRIAFEPDGFERVVAALEERGVGGAVFASPEGPRKYRTAFLPGDATAGAGCFFCEYDPPFVPAEGGKGALKVKKLDHVVIATEDLDDALRLWERNMGLRPDASLDKPLGAGFKVARLPIGESFLELVQPVSQEGRFYEQVQERGEGLFSISVQVEDLDEAVSFLKGKGVKVSEPEPSIWPGARLARINREFTHGVSIQLIERK
jgi:methylmalonyl-CoA/ethylmalonyl-CoA epimerase